MARNQQSATRWAAQCKHCKTWHEPIQNGRRIVAVQCCDETIVLHLISRKTQRTADGAISDAVLKSDYDRPWSELSLLPIRSSRPTALDLDKPRTRQCVWRESRRELRVRKCDPPRLTTKVANN